MKIERVKLQQKCFYYYRLVINNNVSVVDIINKVNALLTAEDNKQVYMILSFVNITGLGFIEQVVKALLAIGGAFCLYGIENNVILNDINKVCGVRVVDEVFNSHISNYHKPLYIKKHIYSGQIIKNIGDIVIIGDVSNGAEITSDHSIYVYGQLRGRALAGDSGDKSAKIIVTSFTPELISISGVYRVIESKNDIGLLYANSVLVELDQNMRLSICKV